MSLKSLYFIGLCLLCTACYQDVEGCLDVNASNLDLDADFSCPNNDCCTYPSLSLAVTQLLNGERIRSDSFYRDAANNQYRLNLLRYYLTELVLNEANGNVVTPVDFVEFGLVSPAGDTSFQLLNDNLVLISSASSSSQSFGNFLGAEVSQSLSGKLGVDGLYRQVFPASAPANHPLSFQANRMHYGRDSSYLQLKLEYELIQGADTLRRAVNVLGTQEVVLLFPGNYAIPRGVNVTIEVEAELAILLSGIDLAGENSSIVNQLIANAPAMWTVTDLVGN